jgi:hypothetical protein
LQSWQAVLVGKLVPSIGDFGFNGSTVKGALTDDIKVLAALTHIGRDCDDFGTGFFSNPADRHRGIETSRIGQYYALFHCMFPSLFTCWSNCLPYRTNVVTGAPN